MKVKRFLYAILLNVICGCSTTYNSYWSYSTYEPSQHTFNIDSAYLSEYGMESAKLLVRHRPPNDWFVDSIVCFYFCIEKKETTIPIMPIFYRIEYQKQKALYNFQVSVRNNKIYKSLDSVSYTIYDSLRTVYYDGGYKYNLDILESRPYELFKTPFLIDVQLKEKDIVYGDIELFFIDYNNKQVVQSIQKIKFKYKEGKYFTSDINS